MHSTIPIVPINKSDWQYLVTRTSLDQSFLLLLKVKRLGAPSVMVVGKLSFPSDFLDLVAVSLWLGNLLVLLSVCFEGHEFRHNEGIFS
jgi:putative copper export protein